MGTYFVMQALTGAVGEILVLPMRFKFLHHETSTTKNSLVPVQRWQVTLTYKHSGYVKDYRYGLYTTLH